MALPAMALLQRKKLIGFALESTQGTSVLSSVTTANGILAYDAKMVPVDLTAQGERRPHGHYLGQIAATVGNQMGRLTFRHEVRHNDGFITLLQACGYALNTSYKPSSSVANHKTLSIKLWEDGRMKALTGAIGTCRLSWSNGGFVTAEWEFIGVWQAPTAVSLPSQSPVTTVTKYLSAASTFTVGGATVPRVANGTIDLGNTISMREDFAVAAGLVHGVIEDRAPMVELDFEAHLIADFNPFSSLLAGTTAALNLVFSDGTNTLTVTAPALQYMNIGDESRGGRLTDPSTFRCCASSGDDELTFAMA